MMLEHLRRITRDGRWIPEIDGLRLLAILSVFLFHLGGEIEWRTGRHILWEPRYGPLMRILGNGDRGVRLFFILSGLILALPFARQFLKGAKPVSIRKYYLRRLTRLEPPYLAALLLVALLTAVWGHGLPPCYALHALATLFYQHTLIYNAMSSVNSITWSLEVEIQFYLVAPLVMLLLRIPNKLLRRGFFLALILGLGCVQAPLEPVPRAGASILFYLQYFLTGILLADVFVIDLDGMRSSWLWDGAGLAALIWIAWERAGMTAHTLLPIPMAVLILSTMRSRALRRCFAAPWIAVLGGMCYSIYLLHFTLMAALFKITRRLISPAFDFMGNYAVQLMVLGTGVMAGCTLFYLVIERPCMDPEWPSKLWHRLTGRREAELAALDATGISE